MFKNILSLLLLITSCISLEAQVSVLNRILLIGDAGDINTIQKNILKKAEEKIIQGKTRVIYLGDNIYPSGLDLFGEDSTKTKDILQSQFKSFRSLNVPVDFVPGNHDWDRSGSKGYEKIKATYEYLKSFDDQDLNQFPINGCPDPVVNKITDDVVVIYIDSEWLINPQTSSEAIEDCNCTTPAEVKMQLADLVYQNRNKTILLVGHHPLLTYGNHGGKFHWMDHIFPLRAANKKFYIPLPIIGSLYPLLRSTISHPQDIAHPKYQQMSKIIKEAFTNHKDWIYIAGHEHGLQYLQDKNIRQIVSGGGSRVDFLKETNKSKYSAATAGFASIDILHNGKLNIQFYSWEDENWTEQSFITEPVSTKNTYTAYQESISSVGDSIVMSVYPKYDDKNKFHRWLFGENFRKEYATPVKVPIFRISELYGGLTPTQRGGGMQSVSLRLVDSTGTEYALRSVLKRSENLLPQSLRSSFAKDWVDDAMSAQHPFGALIVPAFAEALEIPHAKPIIGYVAPDTALQQYNYLFANSFALLEERNPLGKSDNTIKFLSSIQKDNDNRFDARTFLKSRILDVFIGDWDRHEDQWRWKNLSKKNEDKNYINIPRDRDQVMHKTEGIIPSLVKKPYLLPTLQGFGGKIDDIKYSLIKSNFLNAHPFNQFSRKEWNEVVQETVQILSDSLITKAVQNLPIEYASIREDELITSFKERREALEGAFDDFYRFIHKKMDIRLSDKNEKLTLSAIPNGNVLMSIQKINKNGKLTDTLLIQEIDKDITKELRLYLENGNDSVLINNEIKNLKIRIIGGKGENNIQNLAKNPRIRYYGMSEHTQFDNGEKMRTILSKDSSVSQFVPVNLYNFWAPNTDIGLNVDDGLILGTGFIYTHKSGFRKLPYSNRQSLTFAHSFSTNAFRIRYKGEWNEVFRKTNFLLNAYINAPNNTINFYGHGNETKFSRFDGHKKFYRARYSLYNLEAYLKFKLHPDLNFKIGPSLQLYHYSNSDTAGRYINLVEVKTFDSIQKFNDKTHIGVRGSFELLKRNRILTQKWGYELTIDYEWMWQTKSTQGHYGKVKPKIIVENKLDGAGNIRLYNRIGSTIVLGENPYYESAFLGGQDNLLGYRQFRFAGTASLFHNIELHAKILELDSYILPGSLGLIAVHDLGRVWIKDESSRKLHNSYGGGFYLAPGNLTKISFMMVGSKEGWYPYLKMGVRL